MVFKKTVFAVLAALLFIWIIFTSSNAFAATKTATFKWEQPLPLTDLAGWKIYKSSNPDGSVSTILTQVAYDGQARPEYTGSAVINQPDGTSQSVYFYVTAFDVNGNESGKSNIVSAVFDFEAPAIPVKFTITISPN